MRRASVIVSAVVGADHESLGGGPVPETAVVTGAGGGLERSLVSRLSAVGYDVLATDLNAEAARGAAETAPRAWSAAHDVRDPDAHRRVAQDAAERGRLTVWVNNAAVLPLGRAWSYTDSEISACIDANVIGVMHGSRAAIDVMRARPDERAHVVNVASFAAFGPIPQLALYTASKHAVAGFNTSLQGDLRAEGWKIRAHLACLDGTDTPMMAHHRDDPRAAVLRQRPLLDPDDVAQQIVASLSTRRLVTSVPRARGLAARLFNVVPGLSLRLLELSTRK